MNNELVNISFALNNTLALVGESGSGKSLTLKAILRLLPSNLNSIIDIDSDFELTKGKNISFVPQNAFTALSPMTKIREQCLYNIGYTYELFEILGLDKDLMNRFPSQLSGGQQQRIIISMALSVRPKLLLLDEPTTALDPKLREDIVNSLLELQKRLGFLILFVTHDINIAKKLCKDIIVLKDGRVVESGKSKDIINSPKEAYTKRLIESNFANRKFRL
ncbi:MAG: ABC transporter ATP-binding protein [Sulfurovum sp.]|nr:ABC transporter ATP-binding protein [Sulfurovaceae bacterium]